MSRSSTVNQPDFPVIAELRNPNIKVKVMADGRVIAVCAGRDSHSMIAQHEPDTPGFGAYMSFWARTFKSHSRRSLALTQLVVDLGAGRVEQDPFCPTLFFDKYNEEKLSDGSVIYPLLEVTSGATIKAYNPDTIYLNEGYVLARNPKIKFHALIEDCDGNDLVTGVRVGITVIPGERPVFKAASSVVSADAMERAVSVLPVAS